MPPKAKFTKEEIVSKALDVATEYGIEGLTARSLGKALGSSTRPIFTVFNSMEEVCDEVKVSALERFSQYAEKAKEMTPVFKGVGMQMISFAKDYPKLYRVVFMSDSPDSKTFDDVFAHLGDIAPLCIEFIEKDYGLSDIQAKELFKQVWIYTYGLATLIATGMCRFSDDEISNMLSNQFSSLLKQIKSEN